MLNNMNGNTHADVVANDVANDIDNANEEMMMMYANVVTNANVVNTNTNANGESNMRVTKVRDVIPAATSAIPSIFIEMFFNETTKEIPQLLKQLHASSVFRTCYDLLESAVCKYEVYEYIMNNIEETGKRNNNLLIANKMSYRAGDFFLEVFNIIIDLGYMEETIGGIYTVTDKFHEAVSGFSGLAPMEVGEARRVPFMKNGVTASMLAEEACGYLQATEFNYSVDMANIIIEANAMFANQKESPLLEAVELVGKCFKMDVSKAYCTEVDMDYRGRMYNVAHAGPNAQKDDMNKGLYYLVHGGYVEYKSDAYYHLIAELEDVCSKKRAVVEHMCSEQFIMRVAKAPAHALYKYHNKVSKPYQYVRMCIEIANIIKNGNGYIHYPVGLDAKCSGSQIYAILAGDMTMLRSCGFSLKGEIADPYLRTINMFNAITNSKYGFDAATLREAFKTPYMAVSYSGGLPSLLGDSKLMSYVPEGADKFKFAEQVLESIHAVFGTKIMGLIKVIQDAVLTKCEEDGVENFAFTMHDGALMHSVACPKVDITMGYSEIRFVPGVMIAFGSKLEDKGLTVSSRVPCKHEFARKFCVNYIHALDALIARNVVVLCKEAGIKNVVSIHDCFRVGAADVTKLKGIIQLAYKKVFIDNDPLKHLFEQIGVNPNQLKKFGGALTEEMIYQEGNFFFCV